MGLAAVEFVTHEVTPSSHFPSTLAGAPAWLWVRSAAFVPLLASGPDSSAEPSPAQPASSRPAAQHGRKPGQSSPAARVMNTEMYQTPMEVAVYQLHNFSISFFSSLLGGDVVSVKLDNSASGASVVAIDNKIEQAMDLVKNHLMYAVREEVEILKEQIRELVEKNSQLERENTLLKTLASPEQLEKFQSCLSPEEPAPESPQVPEAPGGSAV